VGRIRAMVRKEPPQKDQFDLNEMVREVFGLTQTELYRNGISLRTQLSDSLPRVVADRIQLQQVLLNLILNAVESMAGTSDPERDLLIITEPDDARYLRVVVSDSGPRLAPDNIPPLFEAFYTTKPGGMGMGLSICRSIVEAHGGQIWAKPNEPHGAVFEFTIPSQ